MPPIGLFLLIQHGPSVGYHHEAAADLHHRNGNAEEVKDMRPDQKRRDEQNKTIYRHLARQRPSCRSWIITGQSEKNRAAAERIHNREERAQDEQ